MTTDIVEAMERELHPKGTIVVIEAEHFCMSIAWREEGRFDDRDVCRARVFRDDRRPTGPRPCNTSINEGPRGAEPPRDGHRERDSDSFYPPLAPRRPTRRSDGGESSLTWVVMS